MTKTAPAPTATDWSQVTFAVLTATPLPSEYQPVYSTTGHAAAGCPAIKGATVATETSLDDFLAANEFFDGEVSYRMPWPCGTCVSVHPRRSAPAAFEAPRPDFGNGPAAPRPAVAADPQADADLAEAKAYAASYTGTFQFMVDMKAKATRPGARFTPAMVAAVLKCKAADARRAAGPATPAPAAPQGDEDARRATLKVNVYGGTCRVCSAPVADNAGRRENVAGRWTVLHSSTAECSAVVNAPAPAAPPAAPLPSVPDGKYAVNADAGHLSFYEVRTPTEGKWAGYTFVDLLIGAPGSWRHQKVARDQRPAVMAKITADVQGAAATYGLKFEQCGQCGSPLSHERSRKAGYGQTCAGKNGWAW